MRLRICLPVTAGALLVAMIVPGTASAHGTHVKAKMAGSKVVGQAGAPNGEGTASLHLLRNKGRVCFRIKYSGLGSRNGLEIGVYKGKTGQNGNQVITLVETVKKDPIEGCVNGIPRSTLRNITRSPRRYHVNVKTDLYRVDGAIRGQLKAV